MAEHFVIAGAQRSGTTHLYELLDQHPQICMATPMRPEPKFFLEQDAKQSGYDEYLSRYFPHWRGEAVLGEKSTSYIERFDAIPRLKALLPKARIIFVLRDPVLRAYSNWRFSKSNGIEPLDFAEALDAEHARIDSWRNTDVSVCPYAYTERGHYSRYLARWAESFAPQQITVITSENLFRDHGSLRDLFRALHVATDVPIAQPGKINASDDDETSPPGHVIRRLQELYRQDRQILADRWKVDVTAWLR